MRAVLISEPKLRALLKTGKMLREILKPLLRGEVHPRTTNPFTTNNRPRAKIWEYTEPKEPEDREQYINEAIFTLFTTLMLEYPNK
jgi:hypothetical protein